MLYLYKYFKYKRQTSQPKQGWLVFVLIFSNLKNIMDNVIYSTVCNRPPNTLPSIPKIVFVKFLTMRRKNIVFFPQMHLKSHDCRCEEVRISTSSIVLPPTFGISRKVVGTFHKLMKKGINLLFNHNCTYCFTHKFG